MPGGLSDSVRASSGLVAGACGLGLADFLRLIAQLIRLLDKRLLLGRILLEVGLEAEQEVLVNERLGVIGLDLERAVNRLDALINVGTFVRLLNPRVAVGLVPIEGGDRVERLGVVRFPLRALLGC